MQREGSGGGLGLRALLRRFGLLFVLHGHGEGRVVQAKGGQFDLRGVIGRVVGQDEVADPAEVVLDQVRVQGQGLLPALQEVDVLVAVGGAARLDVGDALLDRAGQGERGHGVHLRDLVVVDQVRKLDRKGVHGVGHGQVDVAVPDGDVALVVHGAHVAERDGVGGLGRADLDGTLRLLQAVLRVVRDVADDKGRVEGGKGREQFLQGLGAHGERLVRVVDPGSVLVEGVFRLAARPGEGGHVPGVDGQDGLPARLDLLLLLLHARGQKRRRAHHSEHADQDQQPLRPVHSDSSFFSRPPGCRCPGTRAGRFRSSRSSAATLWTR